MSADYYDGTRLLSLKDLNGNTPEIYLITSNRTAGKTTYYSRLLVNSYIKRKEKFMLLYRYNYELDNCVDSFFKDISTLFFKGYKMEAKKRANGIYFEMFLNGNSCGYAVALNNAENVKKYSHMFSDVFRMFFDEFQSETNKYCPNEIKKFQSVHTSVARGQGEQVRYVPVYLCGNPVTILNPYYVSLGISSRLSTETKFLKGDGFILEQGFNESASEAQLKSGFNRAFNSDSYVAYSAQGIYLNDNKSFIEKPKTNGRYLVTLKYKSQEYAIREFVNENIIYCDDRADMSFKDKISVTTDDHEINYVMLKRNDFFIQQLRYFFEKGCFRFKDLRCKEAILSVLSY